MKPDREIRLVATLQQRRRAFPVIHLSFANLSVDPVRIRLRTVTVVATVQWARPAAPPSPLVAAPDEADAGERLDGREFAITAGALVHLRSIADGPTGDEVVVVLDVTEPARTTTLAFAYWLDDRHPRARPPTSTRSPKFRRQAEGMLCDDSELRPLNKTWLRRHDFSNWDRLAWDFIEESQRTALYQEAWLRAYKNLHNGWPAEDLFETVHRGVQVLRPVVVGTHYWGEEPGFSGLIACAVADAIDTFREDERSRPYPLGGQ